MAAINEGLRLCDVIERVNVPNDLLQKPYLKPQYDQIEFVVRNIWRMHAGWWDGNPSHLEPVHDRVLAKEIVALAGGITAVQIRIRTLIRQETKESLAVAAHLVSILITRVYLANYNQAEHLLYEDDSQESKNLYEQIYSYRSLHAGSTMATGIYSYTAGTVTPEVEEFKKILAKI